MRDVGEKMGEVGKDLGRGLRSCTCSAPRKPFLWDTLVGVHLSVTFAVYCQAEAVPRRRGERLRLK
jgi:hypothetical protein